MINKLEELLKHVDSTTALLTRTKQQMPLNRGQRECVEEEFEQLQTLVTLKVKYSSMNGSMQVSNCHKTLLRKIRWRPPTGAKKVKRARSLTRTRSRALLDTKQVRALTRMQGSWGSLSKEAQ